MSPPYIPLVVEYTSSEKTITRGELVPESAPNCRRGLYLQRQKCRLEAGEEKRPKKQAAEVRGRASDD